MCLRVTVRLVIMIRVLLSKADTEAEEPCHMFPEECLSSVLSFELQLIGLY